MNSPKVTKVTPKHQFLEVIHEPESDLKATLRVSSDGRLWRRVKEQRPILLSFRGLPDSIRPRPWQENLGVGQQILKRRDAARMLLVAPYQSFDSGSLWSRHCRVASGGEHSYHVGMHGSERFEPIPPARFETTFSDGTEWLVSRAARNWSVIIFLGIWLTGWSIGGIAAAYQMLSGKEQGFLAIWLVFWFIAWVFAASTIGWQLFGSVRLTTNGGALVYKWAMPFFAREKRYDVRHVRNIRASERPWPWNSSFVSGTYPPFVPGISGSVKFDYGGRTIGLMPGLDEAEGKAICDWLQQRLP